MLLPVFRHLPFDNSDFLFVKCLKREVANKDVIRYIYQTKVSKVLSNELFWYKYQTANERKVKHQSATLKNQLITQFPKNSSQIRSAAVLHSEQNRERFVLSAYTRKISQADVRQV